MRLDKGNTLGKICKRGYVTGKLNIWGNLSIFARQYNWDDFKYCDMVKHLCPFPF